VTFVVVAAALFALYAFPYAETGISERWFHAYLRGYARLAGAVIWLFDRQVTVADSVISGRYALTVVKTCDAMEANLLLIAAIIAWPLPASRPLRQIWWRKPAAILVGVAALVAVNVARICSLYFIGVHAPSAFELVHVELWPLLLIAIALAEFVLCTIWLSRTGRQAAAAAGPA
jgi:exosortase/archaeosortase family protein